jgi:phage shock protein PspC (stress-responsive transcriptional regulator)
MVKLIIGSILLTVLPLQMIVGYLLINAIVPDAGEALYGLTAMIAFIGQGFQLYIYASLIINGYKEMGVNLIEP